MDEHWTNAAHEMVAYFGREAVCVAARRAAELARRGDWPAADRAMRLLSQVEGMHRGKDVSHA